MSKKNLFIIVLTLSVILNLGLAYQNHKSRLKPRSLNLQKNQSVNSGTTLGNECSFRGGENSLIPRGFQCYFYSQPDGLVANDLKVRKGMWIIPDITLIRPPGIDFRRNVSWKTYSNSKLGLAFDYPSDFKIQEGNFESPGIVDVLNKDGEKIFGFGASKIPPVASNLDEMMRFIESGNALMDKQGFINQNGFQGMVYAFQPKTSLATPWVLYDLDYEKRVFVTVQYNKNLATDLDYINESMLQSLRIIK